MIAYGAVRLEHVEAKATVGLVRRSECLRPYSCVDDAFAHLCSTNPSLRTSRTTGRFKLHLVGLITV